MSISRLIMLALIAFSSLSVAAQQVDYSAVSGPEEAGIKFVKITQSGDYVAMPIVKRSRGRVEWLSNRIIDISPDGKTLAFLSDRNGTTNIFLKNLESVWSSVQRTQRTGVMDFAYSPDGKQIYFSESRGRENQIFSTDANNGYACRQVTTGSDDYSPVVSGDQKQIFFCRGEANGLQIWGYDLKDRYLSSYFPGFNPAPIRGTNTMIVVRTSADGINELWKIDLAKGTEECILADPNHNFTSPSISPDGKWVVMVGDSYLETPTGGTYGNTDIYAVRTDGTQLTQITSHAADDLSPVWSADGKQIYFISQRGDADGTPNIWRMDFVH